MAAKLCWIVVVLCTLTAGGDAETAGTGDGTPGVLWRQGFEGPEPALAHWNGVIGKTVESHAVATQDGRTAEHVVIQYMPVEGTPYDYWQVKDFEPMPLAGDSRKLTLLARIKSNCPVALKANIRIEGGGSGIIDSARSQGKQRWETIRIEDIGGFAKRTVSALVQQKVVPQDAVTKPLILEVVGFDFVANGKTTEIFVDEMLIVDEALYSATADAGGLPFRVGWARRTGKAPLIDGHLSEDEGWDQAPTLDAFTILDKGLASIQTFGKILFDDRAIYLGVRCPNLPGNQIKADVKFRDGAIWEEDSIEIFMVPPESSVLESRPEGSRYFHFGMNALGTRFDGIGMGSSWNADWTAKTKELIDVWEAEIMIPLEAIGVSGAPEGVWVFNLCRTRSTAGRPEHTAWSPVGGPSGFHDVEHFGQVLFGEGEVSLGMLASIVLRENLRSRLDIFRDGLSQARSWVSRLPDSLPGKAPLNQRLIQIAKVTEKLAQKIDTAKEEELAGLFDSVPPRIAVAQAEVDEVIFKAKIMSFEKDMPSDWPFVVLAGPAMTNERFVPGQSLPKSFKVATKLSAFAAPGEIESMTFVLYAPKDLKKIRVSSSDLVGEAGVIPAEHLDVRVVKYWYQSGREVSRHMEKPTGPLLVPELLLKDDSLVVVDRQAKKNFLREPDGLVDISDPKADLSGIAPKDAKDLLPFDIPAGEIKQIWINIHVPDGSRAGIYTGNISVEPEGLTGIELPVSLEVLPIKLAPPALEYSIFFMGKLSKDGLPNISTRKIQWLSQEQYLAQVKNLLEHGVDNPLSYAYQGKEEYFRREMLLREQAGMPKRDLYILTTDDARVDRQEDEAGLEKLRAGVKWYVDFARENGYRDVYVFSHPDEPSVEQIKKEGKATKAAHEVGAKTFVPIGPDIYEIAGADIDLSKLLDVFIVAGPPKPEMAQAVHRGGGRIMCYANPQVGVEEPLTYRRNFGLLLWKAGYDGTMNFAYQYAFDHMWNDWDEKGHRDHVFVYSTIDGVIDTVAWEGFREGVDDVRYISTLLAAIENAKTNPAKREQALAAEKWVTEIDIHGDLDIIRRQIAGKIVALTR